MVALALALAPACRGNESTDPPVHLNPNMDKQERYLPQERNGHFADTRSMRPQVPGTVARGELRDDDHLHLGLVHGAPARRLPVKLDRALLDRGRERYGIYCRPCHDGAGLGDGIVARRGMLPPPSFADRRLLVMPVGQIYQAVSAGVRTMPSYAAQISVRDRWAIVAHVRALQAARSAGLQDVPADIAESRGWSGK